MRLDARLQLFVDDQRLAMAREFVTAMRAVRAGTMSDHGVLITGPTGVGKSAVGLLTFLTCFAQGLPVVCIPSAADWVTAEVDEAGGGHEFFLTQLLRQNADIVIADPLLRAVLEPALVDGRMDGSVMGRLRRTLRDRPGPVMGVIIDGLQAITAPVTKGSAHSATAAERAVESVFRPWHTWDISRSYFVRMDMVSSHSGPWTVLRLAAHRMRLLRPWSPDVVAAATTAESSPLRLEEYLEAARHRIADAAGGLPGSLATGIRHLRDALSSTSAHEHDIDSAAAHAVAAQTAKMASCLRRWFSSVRSARDRLDIASVMLRLVRGDVGQYDARGLYDAGLVWCRRRHDVRVRPVCPAAASAIVVELSKYSVSGLLLCELSAARGCSAWCSFALEPACQATRWHARRRSHWQHGRGAPVRLGHSSRCAGARGAVDAVCASQQQWMLHCHHDAATRGSITSGRVGVLRTGR